jgi:hypothetical protein
MSNYIFEMRKNKALKATVRVLGGLSAIAIMLVLAACPGGEKVGNDDTPAPAGKTTAWGNAPDFTFTGFDGISGKLSDHGGRPLVVNFWAAW